MAHPIKNVSNEQVLNALRGMGIQINGPVSMTGAQNSEWKRNLFRGPLRHLGQEFENTFSRAVETAKDLALIEKDNPKDPIERLSRTLQAYGLKGDQYSKVIDEAKRIANSKPMTLRPAGQAFNANDYLEAARKVLGDVPMVQEASRMSGIQLPAAPAAPAPLPGDVRAAEQPAPAPAAAAPQDKKTPAAGGGGGGGGGGGSTEPTRELSGATTEKGLKKNASDAEVEAYFRRNYGASVWMIGIPEFKDLMRKVALNPSGYSPGAVASEVQKSQWWQANGENVAEYLKLKANSTIKFQDKVREKTDWFRGKAASYGMTLSDEKLQRLGDEALKWGWSEADMNRHLADEFDYQQGQHTVFTDRLFKEASDYLVPVGEGVIDQWGKRLISNPEEQGNWKEFLKEQAKSMFADKDFQRRLDEGFTMAQIVDPYKKLAAQTLEIDEGDVDFMNQKWMAALDTTTDKGERRAMTYSEWTNKLKNDEQYRYDYTDQAKQAAISTANGLLKKFGAIA